MEKEVKQALDRYAMLDQARKLSGKPSRSEIEDIRCYLRGMQPEDIIFDGDFAKEKLLAVFPQYKNIFSLPKYCAMALQCSAIEHFWVAAREHNRRGNEPFFRYYFDFTAGFTFVLGGILAGEAEFSDLGEQSRLALITHKNEKRNVSTAENAEEYLLMKKFDNEAMKNLIKDKTGKSLINKLADKVKQGEFVNTMLGSRDCIVRKYAWDGAKTAVALYEKLYNMIESSCASRQQNGFPGSR